MGSYSISLNAEQDAGVQAACDAHNAARKDEEGFTPYTPQTYVQFVMGSAADSYAKQYPPSDAPVGDVVAKSDYDAVVAARDALHARLQSITGAVAAAAPGA